METEDKSVKVSVGKSHPRTRASKVQRCCIKRWLSINRKLSALPLASLRSWQVCEMMKRASSMAE